MPLSQSRAGQMPCSSKLCRSLFGPVDHHELQNEFEGMLKQHLEEARQRWNFDFETETPLEGQFKWERVFQAEQPPQEVHSLAKATSSENSLVHKVPAKIHRSRISPEYQQSLELYRAASPLSLKRGLTTMKAEDAPKYFIPFRSHGLRLSSKIRAWSGYADFYSAKRRTIHDKPKPDKPKPDKPRL